MSYNPMIGGMGSGMNPSQYGSNMGMIGGSSSFFNPSVTGTGFAANTNPPPASSQPQGNTASVALFYIPSDATNSLYVDGIPNDSSEREVSRKQPYSVSYFIVVPVIVFFLFMVDVFRPFPGFQCIRLIRKSTSSNREYFLCFVDFENAMQSTIAMNTLQGYRFDKDDTVGLKISYANEKQIKPKHSSRRR